MRKRLFIILIIVAGIAFWLGIIVVPGFYIYNKRGNLADYYSGKASKLQGLQKIRYLELANLVEENNTRKLNLAENLFEQGYFEQGKKYVDQLPEGEPKSELTSYYQFSNGNYGIKLETTTTKLGKLLFAAANDNYQELSGLDLNEIDKVSTKVNARLHLANYFLRDMHNPGLARYLLFKENESNPNVETVLLITKSYEAQENYNEALKWAKELIKLDPANISSYELAKIYADKLGNQAESNQFQLQINTLQNLKK